MASRLAAPELCLGPLLQEMPTTLGAVTPGSRIDNHCRVSVVTTPGSRTRAATPSICSPAKGAPRFGSRTRSSRSMALPGFQLSHARSDSRSRVARSSKLRHAQSSWRVDWRPVWGSLETAGSDSRRWLAWMRGELSDSLRPPSQLRDAWQGASLELAAVWMYCICALSLFVSVLLLAAAFSEDALSKCRSAAGSPASRAAELLITSLFMFGAGAILATENPVRWMLLHVL